MPSYVKVVSDLEYNTLPSPASRARLAAAVSSSSNAESTSAAETNKETSQEKMTYEGAPSNNGDTISNDTKLPSTNTTNVNTNTSIVNNNSNPTAAAAASDTTVNNNINSSNYSQAAINWADKMKHKSTTTTNTTVAANNTTFTNDTVSNKLAAQSTAQPTTQQPQPPSQPAAASQSAEQQPLISNATINGTDTNGLAPPPKLPQTVQQPISAPVFEAQSTKQPQNSKEEVNKKSKCNKSIAEQAMAALNDDHSSSSDSSSRDEDEEEDKDGDMNEDILLNEAAGVLNGVGKESGRDSVESDNSIITQPPSDETVGNQKATGLKSQTVGLKKNVNGGLSSKGANGEKKKSAVDMNGVASAVHAVQEMDIEQLSSVDNKDSSASSSEKDNMEVDIDDGGAMEVINIDDDDEEEDTNSNSTNNSSNNNNTNRYSSSNLTTEQAEAIEHAFSGIKSNNQTETKTLFNIGPLTNEYKKNMILPENYTRSLMVLLKELAVTLADLVSYCVNRGCGYICGFVQDL